MTTNMALSHKNFKRLQSKKSHSWWWDSHVSPKNSKWLAENLEEMDKSVRRMLKLIEEDGDSFAKKAEMYYQKRPELISLVEEFYRMYRSLAERYDHVTGELRKNIPSDLQSPSSGIYDSGSEPNSTLPSPVPEQKPAPRRSAPRAAGFDFFLGSGGSSTDLQKEGDESSTLTDSESESDDSSVNNYSVLLGYGADNALNKKVIELEIELREMKDRLQTRQDEIENGSFRGERNENYEDLLARIAGYEQDLKLANQKRQQSEEEVVKLKTELYRYKESESVNVLRNDATSSTDENVKNEDEGETDVTRVSRLAENIEELQAESDDSSRRIQALTEELRITKEKLQDAESEIAGLKHQLESYGSSEKVSSLQDQLTLAHKDINTWKTKLNAERREVSKLQERIARLKTSLLDRDNEIRDLKTAVSDAEQKIFPEKAQVKAEISKLSEQRSSLEQQLREWESRSRCLEDDIRTLETKRLETEERLDNEITQLKAEIAERDGKIDILNNSIESLKLERDQLIAQVILLKADIAYRDDRIDQMDKHLRQLHMEHARLIASAEEAHESANKLKLKVNELEKDVERQNIAITEGAEEKREAIRQLCLSLEHYRNDYDRLRLALQHKRVPVLAA